MLSDDLETLSAHVIEALGANKITTQAIVRRLKSYAEDARQLEARVIAAIGEMDVTALGAGVVVLDRARRQKQLAALAERPAAAPLPRALSNKGENDGRDH